MHQVTLFQRLHTCLFEGEMVVSYDVTICTIFSRLFNDTLAFHEYRFSQTVQKKKDDA